MIAASQVYMGAHNNQSPAPRVPDAFAAASAAADSPRDSEASEGSAAGPPELRHVRAAIDVAKAMSDRHRDVVGLLVHELQNARARGTDARERLSHALVLLDETQLALVQATAEANDLAKAKADLEAELARLMSENHRLFTINQALSAEVETSRALATEAFAELEKNRALLQQTIRAAPLTQHARLPSPPAVAVTSQQQLDADGQQPSVAFTEMDRARRQLIAASRQVNAPRVEPSAAVTEMVTDQQPGGGDYHVSPVPPQFARGTMPVPPAHPHYNREASPPSSLGMMIVPSSGGDGTVMSPVQMPTRPPAISALLRADPVISQNMAISKEGHVAAVRSHTGVGVAVYLAAMSSTGLNFSATVHARDLSRVVVGFASAPLDGHPESCSLRCVVRGDGVVVIDCDRSHIETRLLPTGNDAALTIAGPTSSSQRTIECCWDAATRRVTFTLGANVVGTPMVLPPPFCREALCPIVQLADAGDDVIVRRRAL